MKSRGTKKKNSVETRGRPGGVIAYDRDKDEYLIFTSQRVAALETDVKVNRIAYDIFYNADVPLKEKSKHRRYSFRRMTPEEIKEYDPKRTPPNKYFRKNTYADFKSENYKKINQKIYKLFEMILELKALRQKVVEDEKKRNEKIGKSYKKSKRSFWEERLYSE